ncbi:hypothetical protein HMPREF1214_04676, partial [Bacteroides sp. HPS0048]
HSYSLLSIFKFDTKVKEIRGWDKSHTVSAYISGDTDYVALLPMNIAK